MNRQEQCEITAGIDLLDSDGKLLREGWARHPYWNYRRKSIQAPAWRIKEWDYYAVLAPDQGSGITFTISDLGYLGLSAICILDFNKRTFNQAEQLSFFPMGRTGFPETSEQGSVLFQSRNLRIEFENKDGKRTIRFWSKNLTSGAEKGAEGEIVLQQPPGIESMNIATSWAEKRTAFYYNRKINCLPASGSIKIGSRRIEFFPDRHAGVLDWGRGNWTYRNRWYWASASGKINGIPAGWNLGYGFSDRSPASENIIFYKGLAHKLADVQFIFNARNYLQPWLFSSSDGRFEMQFEPVLDRQSAINLLILKSIQHQVFGRYRGHFVLDDGTKIIVPELFGFAEDVLNWW